FASGDLRLLQGRRHVVAEAHAGELDQHRQVDAGDDLDLAGAHHGYRKVRRRAAEHVGENDDAGTGVGARYRIDNVIAALFHIVVSADADGFEILLRADHVLDSETELLGKTAVGDKNDTDHA